MAVFAGCGGGDDDEQPASLTKAEYVKRADEICAATEKEQRKLLRQFQQENQGAGSGPQVMEEMIRTAALPPLEQQAEELAELPPPNKEAAKAEAYVAAVEKASEDVRKEPGTLLATPNAFDKAEDLAREFGFKTCRGA
ncbi:MAG TPA: hypothetical protein VF255_11270 [Solirubrobacterales bacterium]